MRANVQHSVIHIYDTYIAIQQRSKFDELETAVVRSISSLSICQPMRVNLFFRSLNISEYNYIHDILGYSKRRNVC